MAIFTLSSIQELIDSELSCKEICDELVRLFSEELRVRAAERLADENWSNELLTNFWLWLTDSGKEGNKKTEEELSSHIRSKLSQVLERCNCDETLFLYIIKSIRNYCTKDKDLFSLFRRAFYKKAREALNNDSRFVSVKQKSHLFFGLQKWGRDFQQLSSELTSDQETIAKTLKEEQFFPIIKKPNSDSFISSKEISNASDRTLDYESFRFYSTLAIIFKLMVLTGQFGELIPRIVEIEKNDNDEDGIPRGIETIPSPESQTLVSWSEGSALALLFWESLNDEEKMLLADYIIPKASGQKIARNDVVSILGFNNEVTMKNYEERLVESLKYFCNDQGISSGNLYTPFMQELENLIEDLKTGESGHSYMVAMEDK